jgi:membrane-associated phospholipid phosphatase
VLLLAAFVVFTFATRNLDQTGINRPARQLADAVAGGWAHPFFQPAEFLGSPLGSVFIAVAIAAAVAVRLGLVPALGVFAALLVLTIVEGALRLRLDRLPWDHILAFLRQPRGWHVIHSTYPSGHTGRLALLSGVGAITFGRRYPLPSAATVVGVTTWISFQRVESRSHSGVDVIGAAFLGWGLAALYTATLPALSAAQRRLLSRAGNGAE